MTGLFVFDTWQLGHLPSSVIGFPQLELFKYWYTFPRFFVEHLILLASFPCEKLIKQCYCYKYCEPRHGAPTDQLRMPTRGDSLHMDGNWALVLSAGHKVQ